MSERMLFCVGEGKHESQGIGYQKNNMVFNTQVTSDEFDEIKGSLPDIKLPLTAWVNKKDMTDDEKDNSSVWKEIGGFLRTLSYEEAWEQYWKTAKESDKEKILNCKHFDGEIFTKITGIKDFKSVKETIEIGGIRYDKQEVEKRLKDIKPV